MLFLLLLSLFALQQTCAAVCEVCGSGMVVTNSATLVEIIGRSTPLTCADLQEVGHDGLLAEAQCDTAPLLIFEVCGCAPNFRLSSPETSTRSLSVQNILARASVPTTSPTFLNTPTRTTPTSTQQPATAPIETLSSTIPTPNASGSSNPATSQSAACYICGQEGLEISLPNATIDITGEAMSCRDLELLALEGGIPPNQCPFVPSLATLTCGCSSLSNTEPTQAPFDVTTSSPLSPFALPTVSPAPPFATPIDSTPSSASPFATSIELTPSPMSPFATPIDSTPSPTLPPSLPIDSTPSQPTLATSTPSNNESPDCSDGSGSFGDTSGIETEVEFLYEAITTPDTVASALANILTTTFEPALAAALVSGIFSSVCSRRLQRRRRLEVLGLSAKPNDELIVSGMFLKRRVQLVELPLFTY